MLPRKFVSPIHSPLFSLRSFVRLYDSIKANKIVPGTVVVKDNKLWKVRGTTLINPGRRVAMVQVDMKDLTGSTSLQARYVASDDVDVANLDPPHSYKFLYPAGGDTYLFMDNTTFEQIEIRESVIGADMVPYLQDGMDVLIERFEGQPALITFPKSVVMEIVECEPTLRGVSAVDGGKSAVTASGLRLKVPGFVDKGDKIVVSTKDGTYVERVK